MSKSDPIFRVPMSVEEGEAVIEAAYHLADVDLFPKKVLLGIGLSFLHAQKEGREWRMEDE